MTEPDTATAAIGAEIEALRAELASARDGMSAACDALLAQVPEHLKALIPDDLGPAARMKWFQKAQATGLFDQKPTVPETDTGKPKITPKSEDFSTMPVFARMSQGYGKK